MTTIFSDDFESGDLSTWTAIVGSPEVQSTIKRTGQYACASAITSIYKNNSLSKTIAAQTSIYLRFYVYFSALPAGVTEFLIARCNYTSSKPILSVYKESDSIHWRLRDGSGTIRQYATGPEAQTWYCIELKAVVGDESAVYLNGDKILSGIAPTGSSASILLLAYTYSGISEGVTVFFDDVAYSETYNGPQNLTHNLVDALSTDDYQMANKQYLTVDNLSTAEKLLANKSIAIKDCITQPDSVMAFKQLFANDDLSLSDVAQVGVRGHVKTKLFLCFADLAIQLTGD